MKNINFFEIIYSYIKLNKFKFLLFSRIGKMRKKMKLTIINSISLLYYLLLSYFHLLLDFILEKKIVLK